MIEFFMDGLPLSFALGVLVAVSTVALMWDNE